MLKDNLYRLDALSEDNGSYVADLTLLPESPVFAGHFPQKPIVPGVCLVQMAVETIEHIEGCSKEICEAKDIRFISIITPLEYTALRLELKKTDDSGRWAAMFYAGGELRSKLSISICNV